MSPANTINLTLTEKSKSCAILQIRVFVTTICKPGNMIFVLWYIITLKYVKSFSILLYHSFMFDTLWWIWQFLFHQKVDLVIRQLVCFRLLYNYKLVLLWNPVWIYNEQLLVPLLLFEFNEYHVKKYITHIWIHYAKYNTHMFCGQKYLNMKNGLNSISRNCLNSYEKQIIKMNVSYSLNFHFVSLFNICYVSIKI